MSVEIEMEEDSSKSFTVTFRSGGRQLVTLYTHATPPQGGWQMEMGRHAFCVEDIPLIEAAVHELKRLNGTLPPVRGGGMRPAKGGE